MEKLADLEICIMSCLLLKPELMKEVNFQDKHITKHKRLWEFMKSFYKKFGNFDIQLMYSVCDNKLNFENYILKVSEIEINQNNFYEYQKRLIAEYEETKKEVFIIQQIYHFANELYVRSINSKQFKEKIEEIYKIADKSFNDDV